MNDQGAGGGIASHMPTHRRQDSSEEPIPAESTAETRTPAPEPDQANALSQTPQDLPRVSQVAVAPVAEVAPALSRNPSSCSTNDNARPNPEYLTAQTA